MLNVNIVLLETNRGGLNPPAVIRSRSAVFMLTGRCTVRSHNFFLKMYNIIKHAFAIKEITLLNILKTFMTVPNLH